MRKGAGMLEPRMMAYQRNDQAVVCFEDKTMLRQADEASMLIQEVDA